MTELQAELLPGSELSTYVIKLLVKHGIITIQDFLAADTFEISKKSNLSFDCVQSLKTKLRELLCPAPLNLLQHFNSLKIQLYGFGIESLDNLLGRQSFNSNSVFEIFGQGAIGKTRFCHTVALNLVRTLQIEALYIDTKQDFSGSCLYQLMRARNIERSECGLIMQRIKVERTFSLQGVFNILQQLEASLKSGLALVIAIKLVIIDSLPAVWFTLNEDEERLERKFLLCKIANLLHKLAKEHSIAILLVNLAVPEEETFNENADMLEFSANETRPRQLSVDCYSNDSPLKPSLGRYWLSVPHTRLLMKMPEDVDEYSSERLIEITRNSYGPNGGICRIDIKDAGVNS